MITHTPMKFHPIRYTADSKIKCIKITPSPDASFDSFIVPATRTWEDTLFFIEQTLERLAETAEIPWKDIQLNLTGVELTEEEFKRICER